jgi:hypothetical protein
MLGNRLEGTPTALGNRQLPTVTETIRQLQDQPAKQQALMALVIGNMTSADAKHYGFDDNPYFKQAQQMAFQLKTAFLQNGEGKEEDFNSLLIALPAFKQVASMVSHKQLRGLGDYTKMAVLASQLNDQQAQEKQAHYATLVQTIGTNMADILTASSKADTAQAAAAKANYDLQAAQLRSGTTPTGGGNPPADDDKIWGLPKTVVYVGAVAVGLGLLYGLVQAVSPAKQAPSPAAKQASKAQLSGYRNKAVKKTTTKGIKTYTF